MNRVLKEKIWQSLKKNLTGQTAEITAALSSLKESRNSETKSSAGDKHETARAMLHIEIEKAEVQLGNAVQLMEELEKIDLKKTHSKVDFGSLVITDKENYFISAGMGKVVLEEMICYSVSLSSPIGLALKDRVVGEKIVFMGREILIKEIV